ncbi:hypothetical protein [Defluviitalea phaphyphila]|uniref:hypothetical protein n=1 Tax=Defluviitalea phaphyphila TaxID=1473580 RepID=UPI00072FB1C5|nr:hypothetical protein [Defluviitalea phaphyphila]
MKKVSWVIVFLLFNIIPKITWGIEKDIDNLNINSYKTITVVKSISENNNLERRIYSLSNNAAKVTDIYTKGSWSFNIQGNNFTDDIKEVHLIRIYDNETITISKEDIDVISEDEIKVNIVDENADKFSKEEYTGSYNIEIEYEDGTIIDVENDYEEQEITLTGENFRDDIKQITIRNIYDGWEIILLDDDIDYINSSTLNLSLSSSDVEKLAGIDVSDIEITIEYESEYIFDDDLEYCKITLIGENFDRGVQKIILRPTSGRAISLPADEQDIIIDEDDISIINDNKLNIYIEEDNLDLLKEYNHSGDYKFIVIYSGDTSNTEYTLSLDLEVLYNYGLKTSETVILKDDFEINGKDYIENPLNFTLLSKSTPKVIDMYPKSISGYPWFNEKDLQHDILEDRSFLKVTFEDIDGKLEFNSPLGISYLLNSSIIPVGGNTNYLDTDFLNMCEENESYITKYIFIKNSSDEEAYLYIPVKELSYQTDYVVNISAKVLRNDASENGIIDESKRYSPAITWEFTTMANPDVKEDEINIKSVTEDYDYYTPIKIFGDFFYEDDIEVFFNDEEAYDVEVKQSSSGDYYLEVYLPRRRRLEPGLYNIIIKNDDDHITTIYEGFSVLPKGDNIPTEEYKVKNEDIKGEVRADIKVSHDTLYLKSRYRDNYRVELDLDELMGEDTFTRTINYTGEKGDYIRELITKSIHGNVNIYNLTLSSLNNNDEINLYIGRVRPDEVQTAKSKLSGKNIKSDFIEVKGENCTWENIYISIPYKNSSGENLSIYRYDYIRRIWHKEESYIDKVNKTVSAVVKNEGIFVVIEN